MKLKHSLTIFGLVAMLGLGVGVGLDSRNAPVQEAKADNTTIYCKCSQDWWKNGAAVGLYAFNNTTSAQNAAYPGVRMNAVAGKTDLWSISIDLSLYEGIIFTRVNTAGDIADYGAQTNDLPISGTKNYCEITSTTAKWKSNSEKADCLWTEYNEAVADGAYLRGKYHGVTNWDSNVASFSGSDPYNLTAELYAEDEVKAVIFADHILTRWCAINTGKGGTETDKGTNEFPVDASTGNAIVSNRAIYNISLSFNNEFGGNYYYDYSFKDQATTWAETFLGSMTCNNGGNSDLTWNIKEGETRWTWADFADPVNGSYKDLGEIAKNALYGATAADEGSPIVRAAKRHDACVAHYHWTAFMTNGAGTSTRSARIETFVSPLTNVDNNSLLIIVIASSVVTLLAIGGYFYLRKRKEDR